jgi:hypothetical protein
MRAAARETAGRFSLEACADKALSLYEALRAVRRTTGRRVRKNSRWLSALRLAGKEWELWVNRAHAAGAALGAPGQEGRARRG